MSLCGLLAAVMSKKVTFCVDCEGWFNESQMQTPSGLCKKCNKIQEDKIFDHAKKKLRSSTENLVDLIEQYKKKECPKEQSKPLEIPTA